ncbi:hypothetical protein LF1_39600 [Rubripirellula obstinata]|uniref:Uncharacterized protein n=1 Tax=Rubripirellula obstinata TaxID=406547 RepID=A0A5B1CPW1_9BACT|nr:hypothetical protein [Rubripirellula obstinata]KAA1261413.1 hypothetical protein LF1_39600 [Rubripirellula obstinata]
MKMLPVAIVGLIVSLLFQSGAEAQFRHGRFGGVNINVPLGGFGYRGFGPGYYGYRGGGFGFGNPGFGYSSFRYSGFGYGGLGYGGLGYGNFGYRGFGHPGFAPHVGIPVYPVYNYRVPIRRVPTYRVPIYSARVHALDRFVEPPGSYVYPQTSNYRSARPVVPGTDAVVPGTDFSNLVPSDLRADEDSLLQSAGLLRQSLARRSNDADIWLDYLNPDLIIDTIQSGGDGSDLQDLLRNYDGLSGNSDLSDLWIVPGFRRTHQGLRAYVDDAANRVKTRKPPQLDADPVPAPVADPQMDAKPESRLHSLPDLDEELPSPI